MINSENKIKVTGFDFAVKVAYKDAEYDGQDSNAGSTLYMAPEMFSGLPFTPKSDVWALGIILYFLCQLELPFRGVADIIEKQHGQNNCMHHSNYL